LLASGVVGSTVDVDRLLWIPNRKVIFIPHPAQIAFFGIPYHENNATMGTWLGITRSIEPMPWRAMMRALTIKLNDD